jgi:hypothetical protein
MDLRGRQERPPVAVSDGNVVEPKIVTDLPAGLEPIPQNKRSGVYDTAPPLQAPRPQPAGPKPKQQREQDPTVTPPSQPSQQSQQPRRGYVPPAAAAPRSQPRHAGPTRFDPSNYQQPRDDSGQPAHARVIRPALTSSADALTRSFDGITPPPDGPYDTMIAGFEGDDEIAEPKRGHGRLATALVAIVALAGIAAIAKAHDKDPAPNPDVSVIVITSSPEPTTGLIVSGKKGSKTATDKKTGTVPQTLPHSTPTPSHTSHSGHSSTTKHTPSSRAHHSSSPAPERTTPSPEQPQPTPQETQPPVEVPIPLPPVEVTPTPSSEYTPPPTPEYTPTPTPTEVESPTPTPELSMQPEDAALQVLNASIDSGKLQELQDQNSSLQDDINNAKSVLSQTVNSYDIRAAQTTFEQLYSNSDIAGELGPQVSMNTTMLQSMQGQSREISSLVIGNSNQVLNNMQHNPGLSGTTPVAIAVIPTGSDLYNTILQTEDDAIRNENTVDFPLATDTALLGAENISTADNNGQMSIAYTYGLYPVENGPDQAVVSIYVLVPTGSDFIGILGTTINVVNSAPSPTNSDAFTALKRFFEHHQKDNSDKKPKAHNDSSNKEHKSDTKKHDN